MTTYFISDIHLHANSSAQEIMLLEFLQTAGANADAIYILGDLFAIWLGDDLREPYSQTLIAALQDLSKKNIPIYFMRGNRDFLVGARFCKEAGITLLPDPYKTSLYGRNVLLTHGDQLCTLDLRYQKFRRIVQNPILDFIFLLLPIKWRKKIGKQLSRKSRGSPQNPALYDVEGKSVDAWFYKFDVNLMIHGHTHKPAIHRAGNTTRIVLGDWNPTCAQILAFNKDGFELLDLAR